VIEGIPKEGKLSVTGALLTCYAGLHCIPQLMPLALVSIYCFLAPRLLKSLKRKTGTHSLYSVINLSTTARVAVSCKHYLQRYKYYCACFGYVPLVFTVSWCSVGRARRHTTLRATSCSRMGTAKCFVLHIEIFSHLMCRVTHPGSLHAALLQEWRAPGSRWLGACCSWCLHRPLSLK
jgi:hypothetical protein